MIDNPWEKMSLGSKRRASMPHDIYWIREELRGDYGLKISLKQTSALKLKVEEIKFRNIEFIKAHRKGNEVEWYLLLKEQCEWEIFLKLCNDLIDQVDRIQREETMITVIINRLKRWQKLLMNSASNELSPEIQMGLYSELHSLLYHVTQHTTLREAIHSWGGPESDIHDFVFGERALEIKSHRSNRSEFITISNPYQLYSVKKHFNLIVYAMSRTEFGQTISDLIGIVKTQLEKEMLFSEIELLDHKTAQYGYFDLVHKDKLINFQIDKITAYKLSPTFPRMSIEHIPDEVINLKYQIDLSKCEQYKVNIESLLLKETN